MGTYYLRDDCPPPVLEPVQGHLKGKKVKRRRRTRARILNRRPRVTTLTVAGGLVVHRWSRFLRKTRCAAPSPTKVRMRRPAVCRCHTCAMPLTHMRRRGLPLGRRLLHPVFGQGAGLARPRR
jgi:hypothetical protein